LCRAYWFPLYAFVRRLGRPADEAQDLTQEFFARLLEKGALRGADPNRGHFRSYLLGAFKHFLANQREHDRAVKRGGGTVLSLDFEAGEDRYRCEPAHELTPERLYEQRWALTVIDQALTQLRDEMTRAGKADLFDALKVFLSGEDQPGSYRDLAEQRGMSEGAVKVAVHRLRRRFRDVLLAEIAQTVSRPEDADDELRRLFAAVRLPGKQAL
jgi:RNA polymerase sigma-70 factor (ECF subfamily)